MLQSLQRWLMPIVFCAGLLPSTVALANDTPDAMVRQASRQVLDTLKKDDGKNSRQVRAEVEAIAIPKFDFKRMTALAVGRGWKEASSPQQEELQVQFKTLLVRTYTSTMFRFRNAQVNVASNPVISADGNEATVRSQVAMGDGKSVQVDYSLYKVAGEWKVYNVSVEGASLVTVYRNNFNDIIRQSGVDGLIKSLKEKNDAFIAKS